MVTDGTWIGWNRPGVRALSALFGLGMVVASAFTIEHYFAANFPESIWEGSFCDISAFLNCDSSAFSSISALWGVPLGYFGLMVGGLVMLGALFASPALERTNKSLALLNTVGVVSLFTYSVVFLGSLCLLCSGYYVFSIASFVLFWRRGIDREAPGIVARWARPSVTHLGAFGVVTLAGAYGFQLFHDAKQDAQSGGVAVRMVEEFFGLPEVPWPSFISPFWTVRSTDDFEDAPIRIVEYADPLCPDCLYMHRQMQRLKEDFAGKLNVAFQFFPLEAVCNDVVEKDLHRGACAASYMAAYDSTKFLELVDELLNNYRIARTPEWRREFAERHAVGAALTDSATIALVHRIIQTGREYERTSERHAHGIRSTPTMIVNNRLIIGTFPYEQLHAIFSALLAEAEGGSRFMENWVGD